MAEIADQTRSEIVLEETNIPVKDAVKGVCETLGFAPSSWRMKGRWSYSVPGRMPKKFSKP